jgi:hypothetical protein
MSTDSQFDGLGDGFPRRILDRKRVGGGFSGREIQAAGVRRPDLAGRGIERDGFCVGDVVAELRGFAGVDEGRGDVEAADGEFGAAQLLDGEAILFAALFILALLCLPLVLLARFIASEENVRDVKDYAKNQEGGIEKRILERRFRGSGSLEIHGLNRDTVSLHLKLYFNRNLSGFES